MNPSDQSNTAPARGESGDSQQSGDGAEASRTSRDPSLTGDVHAQKAEAADTHLYDVVKGRSSLKNYPSNPANVPRNAPRYVPATHITRTGEAFPSVLQISETGSRSIVNVTRAMQSKRDEVESLTKESETSQDFETAFLIEDIVHIYNDFKVLLQNAVHAAGRTECQGTGVENSKAPLNHEWNEQTSNQRGGQKRRLNSGDVSEECEKETNESSLATKGKKPRTHKTGNFQCWWCARDPVRFKSCRTYCSGDTDFHSYRRGHFADHWKWGDVHNCNISPEIFDAALHAKQSSEKDSLVDIEEEKWIRTYKILWSLNEDEETPDPRCNQPNHMYFKPVKPDLYAPREAKKRRRTRVGRPASQSTLHPKPCSSNNTQNQQYSSSGPLPNFFSKVTEEDIAHAQSSSNFSFILDGHICIAKDLASQSQDACCLRTFLGHYQYLIDILKQQQDQDTKRFSVRDILKFFDAFEGDFSFTLLLNNEHLADYLDKWAHTEPLAGLPESPKLVRTTMLPSDEMTTCGPPILPPPPPPPPPPLHPTTVSPDLYARLENGFVQETQYSGPGLTPDPFFGSMGREPSGSHVAIPTRPRSRAIESELHPFRKTPAPLDSAQTTSIMSTAPDEKRKPASLRCQKPADIGSLDELFLYQGTTSPMLDSDVRRGGG